MRGTSPWSAGERELMAALVAKWNACAFCAGAHHAVASKALSPALIAAVVADFRGAGISPRLKATLAFLEKLTVMPDALAADALDFAIPGPDEMSKAAARLLAKGYAA